MPRPCRITHNPLHVRPGCPAYTSHLPTEEHSNVYLGSMTPICREGDLASENACDQVLITYTWQNQNQGPGFLILQNRVLSTSHPTASLVNSSAFFGSKHMQSVLRTREKFLKLNPTHRSWLHAWSKLQLGYKATWPNRNRAHGGEAISVLFGGQESFGRMESKLFAHKLTQKPRHCSEGDINSLSGSWKFNSSKTEHMLLIS